ncbi:hypothetical protein LCGC14_0437060 [marine sediment metagenome]|uniref:Uncharacterized protein n=1 Tax=marine sediment metagenome TaxID=412755 RepID=A0A0F9T4V8_9ZZZZ
MPRADDNMPDGLTTLYIARVVTLTAEFTVGGGSHRLLFPDGVVGLMVVFDSREAHDAVYPNDEPEVVHL